MESNEGKPNELMQSSVGEKSPLEKLGDSYVQFVKMVASKNILKDWESGKVLRGAYAEFLGERDSLTEEEVKETPHYQILLGPNNLEILREALLEASKGKEEKVGLTKQELFAVKVLLQQTKQKTGKPMAVEAIQITLRGMFPEKSEDLVIEQLQRMEEDEMLEIKNEYNLRISEAKEDEALIKLAKAAAGEKMRQAQLVDFKGLDKSNPSDRPSVLNEDSQPTTTKAPTEAVSEAKESSSGLLLLILGAAAFMLFAIAK
jgi:hypothetical protein